VQPLHRLRLRRHLRRHQRNLGHQPAGIQLRQHLPGVHMIPLLHQDPGDALAVIKGQIDLAQIDVAVQNQLARGTPALREPPAKPANAGNQQDRNDHPFLHAHLPILKDTSARAVQSNLDLKFKFDSPQIKE